jgi:hypothetical protein
MRSPSLLVPALLLATACSSSSAGAGGGGSNDPFVGTWKCMGSSTTNFSQPPNTPPSTVSNASTVVITDDGMGNLTSDRTPDDAGVPCTLHSKLNSDGKSTTLATGQSCTTTGGGTITYTSGGTQLTNPGSYTSTSTWTFSGMTTKGMPLVGTGSGMATCTKM